jgi:hypothetical protein
MPRCAPAPVLPRIEPRELLRAPKRSEFASWYKLQGWIPCAAIESHSLEKVLKESPQEIAEEKLSNRRSMILRA